MLERGHNGFSLGNPHVTTVFLSHHSHFWPRCRIYKNAWNTANPVGALLRLCDPELLRLVYWRRHTCLLKSALENHQHHQVYIPSRNVKQNCTCLKGHRYDWWCLFTISFLLKRLYISSMKPSQNRTTIFKLIVHWKELHAAFEEKENKQKNAKF